MIGLDTNVLVRYLAQDDAAQSARASRLIERQLSEREPGFVGLVVPHALRLAGVQRTRDLALLVPLGGAALVVGADLLARTVAMPIELPVGAVMALLGAPAFVAFLARRGR